MTIVYSRTDLVPKNTTFNFFPTKTMNLNYSRSKRSLKFVDLLLTIKKKIIDTKSKQNDMFALHTKFIIKFIIIITFLNKNIEHVSF